ncbi:MAG: preprotein translocase subunit SecA, partial [Methylacidiphilaceae bacterium]|nr:preprotein translocase subunit SecA [Candidatus Methylacidiphilaceae bacterium]
YELKVKYEEPASLQELERITALSAIDRLWQEHLYAMDGLRGGIGLRAYGQKDPLIEYKQEAYSLFQDLMGRIKREIVQNLFRSASSVLAFERFLSSLPQQLVRPELSDGAAAAAPETQAAGEEAGRPPHDHPIVPISRSGPKMGRNDPCPLDPTKKFKNCCGALGEKTCIKVSLLAGQSFPTPPAKGEKKKS